MQKLRMRDWSVMEVEWAATHIVPWPRPLLLSAIRRTGIGCGTGVQDSDPFQHVQSAMANIKSQKKRNRQNETRRQRNKSIMSELKTSIKKVQAAAAAGEDTDELFRDAQSKIDTAASKGVLHPKTASRRKARLASSLKSS